MEAHAVCNTADSKATDSNDVIEIRPGHQCQDTVLEAQPDRVSEVSEITAEPASKTCPFLLLPGEIRNSIYKYACVWRTPTHGTTHFPDRPLNGLRQPPITRVNRQLRRETLGLFYWEHRFCVDLPMLPIEDYDNKDFENCGNYDYADIERPRQDPGPFGFASKMLNAFIPNPGKALQTSNVSFLSRLTVEMQNGDYYYGLGILGFTMSAKEFKVNKISHIGQGLMDQIGQGLMDTDDLDWDDREEVKKAYFNTIKSCVLCEEATRADGDDLMGATAQATANVLSAVMWLIAGHCPQLTSSVTTCIVPNSDLEKSLRAYWLVNGEPDSESEWNSESESDSE